MDNQRKSTYDPRMAQQSHTEAIRSQFAQRKLAVSRISEKLDSTRQMNLLLTDIMQLVEEIVASCGGEPKCAFIEVARDLIRIETRVPLQANLYPFLPEDHIDNLRFHKQVSTLVLSMKEVHGIRWIPLPDGRGSQMIVSVVRQ